MRAVLFHRSMRLMQLSVAAAICLSACFPDSPECEVGGEPKDVSTYVGEYGAYDTMLICGAPFIETNLEKNEENTVVFLGMGQNWYDDTPPSSDERQTALIQMGENLRDLIKSETEVYPWSIYVGLDGQNSCANADHLSIYISDWDALDGATAVIGEYLADHDLQEEIHLTVGLICH
jgi:hypothetical protein